MKFTTTAALLLAFSISGTVSAGEIVFSTDFESGIPTEISGPGFILDSQGYNIGDFLGNASVNPALATVLTLTGLPTHDSINLDFLLAIVNSWDGVDGGASPDIFSVIIDGVTIFSEAFDNFVEASQTYVPPDGVLLTPRIPTPADFAPEGFANLGFDTGLGQQAVWGDALYSMGRDPLFDNIAHTSDTLTIEWVASGAGYQGGSNEAWALDNIIVSINDNSPGESEDNPILPTDPPLPDGGFVFTEVPTNFWIDPPSAYGYDFATTDGSLITAILDLPTGFLDPFTISTGGSVVGTFGPGEIVDFGAGVSSFSVTGINPGVDPNDNTAFPIRLEFNQPTASLTMTPTNVVPEPSSYALLLMGGVSLALYGWRKKQRI